VVGGPRTSYKLESSRYPLCGRDVSVLLLLASLEIMLKVK